MCITLVALLSAQWNKAVQYESSGLFSVAFQSISFMSFLCTIPSQFYLLCQVVWMFLDVVIIASSSGVKTDPDRIRFCHVSYWFFGDAEVYYIRIFLLFVGQYVGFPIDSWHKLLPLIAGNSSLLLVVVRLDTLCIFLAFQLQPMKNLLPRTLKKC